MQGTSSTLCKIATIRLSRVFELQRALWTPLVGGIALGLAFYSDRLSWLAWIAIVPIAWALRTPRGSIELYAGIFYGGLAFGLLSLDWVRESYTSLLGTWLVSGHFVALMFTTAIWIGRRVVQATSLPMGIVLPLYWTAMEWVRWHAAGIALNDGFPFLQLGATQAHHLRIIQIADLGGVAAVTFLVASVNGWIYDAAKGTIAFFRRASDLRAPVISSLLVFGFVGAAMLYGEVRLRTLTFTPGPRVGIVSGQFGLTSLANSADRIAEALSEGLQGNAQTGVELGNRLPLPDLLVWKEGAASDFYFSDSNFVYSDPPRSEPGEAPLATDSTAGRKRLDALARSLRASLIAGCMRIEHADERTRKFNSAYFLNKYDGVLDLCDKQHLALWWEYHYDVASILGLIPATRQTEPDSAFSKARVAARVLDLPTAAGSYSFATAICYDVFFPADHRVLLNTTPDLNCPTFFVGISDETAENTSSFGRVALALQQFRAIECRRSYVRNAENGLSAIIDGCGRPVPLVKIDVPYGPSVLVGSIPILAGRSFYVRFGEWLPLLGCAITSVLLGISCLPKRYRLRGENGEQFGNSA